MKKAVTGMIGLILSVTGALMSIPFLLNKNYIVGGVCIAALITGLILMAIAWEE